MIERKKVQLADAVPLREVAAELHKTKVFAETNLEGLHDFDQVELVTVPAGAVLSEPGDPAAHYWVVLRR